VPAGLVWGHELHFDATQVQADAALDSLTARFAVDTRQTRQAHDTRQAGLESENGRDEDARQAVPRPQQALQAHLAALFPPGEAEDGTVEVPAAPTAPMELTTPTLLSLTLSDTLLEELRAANAARHDWIAEEGRQWREVRGIHQRTADVRISATDPDATPMRLKGGGTHLGYQTHYVVDGGKQRIIVGVLVAPGEVMENQPMLDLLWRVRFRWKMQQRQVTGDTKYGTVENIRAVEDMGIRAYLPLPDWEQNSAYFGASKFTYDAEHDQYVCPNGQALRRTHTSEAGQRIQYRA